MYRDLGVGGDDVFIQLSTVDPVDYSFGRGEPQFHQAIEAGSATLPVLEYKKKTSKECAAHFQMRVDGERSSGTLAEQEFLRAYYEKKNQDTTPYDANDEDAKEQTHNASA
jgi:hypothetical protein